MRSFVVALAAFSLVAAGAANAKPVSAKPATVRAGDRIAAKPIAANQLGDFGLGLIPTLLLSAAVITVVIEAADNNSPRSP